MGHWMDVAAGTGGSSGVGQQGRGASREQHCRLCSVTHPSTTDIIHLHFHPLYMGKSFAFSSFLSLPLRVPLRERTEETATL